MSDSKETSGKITVAKGVEIAAAAGIEMTRPTVRALFKRSGVSVRIGNRFYMPRLDFERILKEGENAAN